MRERKTSLAGHAHARPLQEALTLFMQNPPHHIPFLVTSPLLSRHVPALVRRRMGHVTSI